MNHDEIVKFWILRSISTCTRIPFERDERADKIEGYIDYELERRKNPEKTAKTIKDLQEEVQRLHKLIDQMEKENPIDWIERKRNRMITKG